MMPDGSLSSLTPSNDMMANAERTYQMRNPSQPQPTASSGGGDWFSHLLPTIGSIAAPVLGAILAPETGGASLLAGMALSGAGSAAGKLGENAMEQKSLDNGVLQSGAEGLAGGALGGIGGKVLGGVLGKVGEGAVATDAAKAVADGYAPYDLGKAAGKLNMRDNIDMLQKLGIDTTDPNNVLTASRAVTGDEGALNGIKNQLIQQAGPVAINPDEIMGLAKQAITANPQIGNKAGATQDFIHQLLQGMSPEGNVSGTVDPQNLFDAIKTLGKAKGGLSATGESSDALGNVYDATRQGLENALYKNAGADKLAASYAVTPEDLAVIQKATGGNQALTKHIVDTLNNATSISDIRAGEAPFVQSSKLANQALEKLQATVPAVEAPESNVGQHLSAGAQLIAGHPIGALGTAAGGAMNAASKAAAMFGALPGAAQAGITAGAGNAIVQPFTHAGDYGGLGGVTGATDINLGGTPMNEQPNGAAPAAAAAPGGQQIDPSLMTRVILADLQSTGGANLGHLVPALQQGMFGGLGQLGADQRNTVANSQTASQALPGLESAFNNAGGGSGSLLGSLENLTAGVNPKLQAYNAQAQALASKVSAATGMPMQQAMQMFPQPTDTQQTAQQKLAAIAQLLQTGASNATQSGFQTPGFGAGGSPMGGLSALGSSAQVGAGLGAVAR